MLKELIISIQSYRQAHQFIKQHKLWNWIVLPGIIYTILFTVSMYFFGKSAFYFIDYINTVTGLKTWLQQMQGEDWWGFFFAFQGITVWLMLILIYFSLFKHIWFIVGAYIFNYLSNKTSSIIEQKPYTFTPKQLLNDTFRSMQLSLRNGFWQLVYAIALFILALIPIIGWIAPLIALTIECYYFGFSMLNCSLERKHVSVSNSIDFVHKHRGLAIGNGMIFYIMHLAVVIGWFLAPAYAVIAATLSLHEQKKNA